MGNGGDPLGHHLGETDGRVEAGPHRRAPLGQFIEAVEGLLDTAHIVGDLLRVAGKFLTERQGRGVLGVGAADLDDVGEGLGLHLQRGVQVLQRRHHVAGHLLGGGDVHGRRIGVVGRLAHVDVVVGVHRRLGAHHSAQHLDGPVGDHLVGVHVRLGA